MISNFFIYLLAICKSSLEKGLVFVTVAAAAAGATSPQLCLTLSNSVQPHRQQPTRLRCPWNSPGKNTGVGCPFLLQCVKVKSCPTLSSPMDCSPPGSSIHGIFRAGILEWVASAFSSIDTRVNLNLESQVLVTLLASQYTFYRHGPYLLS